MRVKNKDVKVGRYYWFEQHEHNARFDRFSCEIKEEMVHQIICGSWTVKNPDYQFAYHRGFAFSTRTSAKKYAIKKIKEMARRKRTEITNAEKDILSELK